MSIVSNVSTTLNARNNNEIILVIALANIILQIVPETNNSQDSAKLLMQATALIAVPPRPKKNAHSLLNI